jgi:hypothetical protein
LHLDDRGLPGREGLTPRRFSGLQALELEQKNVGEIARKAGRLASQLGTPLVDLVAVHHRRSHLPR